MEGWLARAILYLRDDNIILTGKRCSFEQGVLPAVWLHCFLFKNSFSKLLLLLLFQIPLYVDRFLALTALIPGYSCRSRETPKYLNIQMTFLPIFTFKKLFTSFYNDIFYFLMLKRDRESCCCFLSAFLRCAHFSLCTTGSYFFLNVNDSCYYAV